MSIEEKPIKTYFNAKEGTLDRSIFADEEIYREELKKIFGRGWNFMCHESQIPNAGDYFSTFIGEDQVIAVRNKEGKVNVLLNACSHRGNTMCRTEQGNVKIFNCTYHGWNFDLDGNLVNLPGEKEYYREKLDKSKWGLAKAAQVDHRNGFYFATLDPEAPPLDEFLGEVGRIGLDSMLSYGEVEIVDGVQKNVIDCNWKIAVDNIFDWYHVKYSHVSAVNVGAVDIGTLWPMDQMVMMGEYGHGISGPMATADEQAAYDAMSDEEAAEMNRSMKAGRVMRPKADTERLGPLGVRAYGHPHIFPNFWVAVRNMQICLRIPRGPYHTELWWFTFMPKAWPQEQRQQALRYMKHLFGPAGLLEQDDGENWAQATWTSRGQFAQRTPHNLQMTQGSDTVKEEGGQVAVETTINEHGQRWHYQAWTDWMAADSWADLKKNHAMPPRGEI